MKNAIVLAALAGGAYLLYTRKAVASSTKKPSDAAAQLAVIRNTPYSAVLALTPGGKGGAAPAPPSKTGSVEMDNATAAWEANFGINSPIIQKAKATAAKAQTHTDPNAAVQLGKSLVKNYAGKAAEEACNKLPGSSVFGDYCGDAGAYVGGKVADGAEYVGGKAKDAAEKVWSWLT